MDTFLAIASRREVRSYDARPLPADVERRILDAGRLAGSSANSQPWRFVVLESEEIVERATEAVYVPSNVRESALRVAIVIPDKGTAAFDGGRSAQNMMLAAWTEGVGSCPNGFKERDAAIELLDLGDGERPLILLTFGYPAKPRDPESRPPDEWSSRANRKPLDELVRRI